MFHLSRSLHNSVPWQVWLPLAGFHVVNPRLKAGEALHTVAAVLLVSRIDSNNYNKVFLFPHLLTDSV